MSCGRVNFSSLIFCIGADHIFFILETHNVLYNSCEIPGVKSMFTWSSTHSIVVNRDLNTVIFGRERGAGYIR